MQVIEYLKQLAPYNVGETAGVSDEDADKLVKNGIAKLRPDIVPHIAPRSPEQDPPPRLAQAIAQELDDRQQARGRARV
jgi:hypothetical protein